MHVSLIVNVLSFICIYPSTGDKCYMSFVVCCDSFWLCLLFVCLLFFIVYCFLFVLFVLLVVLATHTNKEVEID